VTAWTRPSPTAASSPTAPTSAHTGVDFYGISFGRNLRTKANHVKFKVVTYTFYGFKRHILKTRYGPKCSDKLVHSYLLLLEPMSYNMSYNASVLKPKIFSSTLKNALAYYNAAVVAVNSEVVGYVKICQKTDK
jgi:hypothetical protein